MARHLIVEGGVGSLPASGVTPGSYTNTDITVNSQGIVVAASDGAVVATTIGGLTDVTLTGPISTQFLQYDGADWVNITLTISDVSDVTLTVPSSGDFLTFDGADWVNSTISVVLTTDIGTSVQAWDAELDALAGLTGTGYVVHTGAGTAIERTITGADGIVVANGDGVSGNTTVSVTIDTLPFTTPIDPTNDLIMFYNFDVAQNEQISVEDMVLSATPLLSATSVGTGASVYKGTTAQVLEFKEISTTGLGITVTEITNDIQISLSAELQNLTALSATNDSFIVGNGVSWAVENAATARTALGLGTMALEASADYLTLVGGTMTGAIAMSTAQITGLGDPTLDQDAATKIYVDNNVAVAGAGMTKTGNELNVINNDSSITVGADEISINMTTMNTLNDARYFTQAELGDTTDTTEGASLIGTETKTGLSNAVTVEAALDHINAELPFALIKFRQDISVWNLDVTSPSATRATVNTVEVARFAESIDAAVYKDLLLPFDFDDTKDLNVYVAMGKATAASGNISMAMAWQHQRVPGFTPDDVIVFAPGLTIVPDASTLVWTIPAGTFQALDVVTLRLTRLGSDVGNDTYTDAADLFAAHITQ